MGAGEVNVRALSGEFVINRSATSRYRSAIMAINRGDRMSAIRALDKSGPKLLPGEYGRQGADRGLESALGAIASAVQQGGKRTDNITVIVQLDSDRLAAAVTRKDLVRGVSG